MPRTRSKSPPDCGFAGSLEAHRLLAGPEGRRGAALRKRKHRQTISRRSGLAITHYKKGFTLDICSTFSNARKRPVGFDIRMLELNLRPFMAF